MLLGVDLDAMSPHPYRSVAIASEPPPKDAEGWGEDLLLIGLFGCAGALGVVVGMLADSAVEVSIGMLLVAFAWKILRDVLRARRVLTLS
jgi:hypothetical protein